MLDPPVAADVGEQVLRRGVVRGQAGDVQDGLAAGVPLAFFLVRGVALDEDGLGGPFATALALTASALAILAGAAGQWPAVLAAGCAVPLLYAAGILAVTGTAARKLPRRSLAWLPITLITMHLCWGTGFVTSPRSLVPTSEPSLSPRAAARQSVGPPVR